jgi:glycerol dehydrogenase
VARFMATVGLPVRLRDFCLDPVADADALQEAMQAAAREFIVHNEPFEVTPESLMSAILEADRIGGKLVEKTGDEAFKILRGRGPSE